MANIALREWIVYAERDGTKVNEDRPIMTTPLPQNYANRLRPEVERLVFRLRSSWLLELELNVLPELEPKLSLSCSKALAPAELGHMEASSGMAVLATEFSPDSIPCTIELELNLLPELEPKLSLPCAKVLAPAELGNMEASSGMAVPATEFPPDSIPCTIELELDLLPELEPKLSLSRAKALAPAELGDMEASSGTALLATEFSPDSIPCTSG